MSEFEFKKQKLAFIKGNCCTLYDAGLGRVVEDFGRQCPECPFQYQSDDFIESKTDVGIIK